LSYAPTVGWNWKDLEIIAFHRAMSLCSVGAAGHRPKAAQAFDPVVQRKLRHACEKASENNARKILLAVALIKSLVSRTKTPASLRGRGIFCEPIPTSLQLDYGAVTVIVTGNEVEVR